jgi:UDP-2-acetamido-2-deoxy-ribo-hexuluronate aminotransferase
MKVNFYEAPREYFAKKEELDQAIQSVLTKGNFILGEQVAQLENAICDYCQAKYAVGVASGTDALTIASDILGFKGGKEVITSPFTFLASASCLTKHQGHPVFVDIDAETFSLDVSQIEDRINEHTAGILPIHLFNQMADMDRIMDIAGRYRLKVLEDAAEAFGMWWQGQGGKYRHAGTIGDYGVFSFFPTKTLGGYGDGGMMITNSEELAQKAKQYRVHGASKKYHYDNVGYNSRLDTLQAAVLLVKLKYIDEAIRRREQVAGLYRELLSECAQIKFPQIKGKQRPVYYVFNILAERRDELAAWLTVASFVAREGGEA